MSDDLASLLGSAAEACTLPDYAGGSILNLPAEIGRLLGVHDGWEAPPLRGGVGVDARAVRRVALVLIDGLGWNRLRRHVSEDPAWGRMVARFGGAELTVTSVAPATTTVATTVLLSNGAPPVRTGILGYSQRLPGVGRVADMLYWRAVAEPGRAAQDLEEMGVAPETFLPTPSLFQTLARGGVASEAFLPRAIRRSPLSRLQFRGAAPRGAASLEDALRQLGELFAHRPDVRFAYAYHSELDTVSHLHGPEGEAWTTTFMRIQATLEGWLASLPAAARDGTLVLITADHGLVETPPDQRRHLTSLRSSIPLLAGPPGGEPRHVHLYARKGATRALLDAARGALGDAFVVLDGHRALDAGLYGGPRPRHPESEARVGDVVVVALGGATLWADVPAALRGMHGALDEREMRVPLVALPLSAQR
ncbi:MAG TPA: alkaline phosphatase family protein [Trueperaceae bacterium]|nr:alkaline phosphatase family protein [Trueperaceae bacterium]